MRKERNLGTNAAAGALVALVLAAGCGGDDRRATGSGSGDTGSGTTGTSAGTGTSTTAAATDSVGSSTGTTATAAGTASTLGGSSSGPGTGTGTASSTGGTATGGTAGMASSGSSGGATCVPVSNDEMVCDGIDDDCNGLVDDVDLGGDGFCDCLSIGILGAPGTHPSANFQQWLMDQGTTVVRFGTTPAYTLTLADLEPYDILIIDNLPKVFSATEQAEFAAWLADGGAFVSMAGYVNTTADRDEQNSLVAASGLSYVGQSVLLEPQTEWAPHPISQNLGTVRFLGGWVVQGPGDTVMHVLGDPTTRLGVAVDNGSFRAFVYGDEWVSFDSEWTNYPSVPVFWENVLKWLSPPGYCLSPQ